MTNRCCRVWTFVVCAFVSTFTVADEPKAGELGVSRLRLLNTEIFGKSASDTIKLLSPGAPDKLNLQNVLVDVDKGKYFAATVRYPKKISFAEARASLNALYAKHELKFSADAPDMGLWKNKDEELSIQLSEDEEYLQICYVKVSLVTMEIINESIQRLIRQSEREP